MTITMTMATATAMSPRQGLRRMYYQIIREAQATSTSTGTAATERRYNFKSPGHQTQMPPPIDKVVLVGTRVAWSRSAGRYSIGEIQKCPARTSPKPLARNME